MAKPTKFPEWAELPYVDPVVGGSNIVEPPTQLKNTGWLRKQKPPANYMNWLFNLINQWIEYFDGEFTNDIQTGDVKASYRKPSDAGMDGFWVIMDDGSISKGGAGGTTRANDDTIELYKILWDNVSDTYCPVSTGRGASAQADFDAGKTLTLAASVGRALSNVGGSPTAYVIGQPTGAQTHQLTIAELAAHTHDVQYKTTVGQWVSGGNVWDGETTTSSGSTGGDTAHNNMQPSMFLNFYIKL